MSTGFTNFLATHSWILPLIIIWTIPWKGVALWRAARNQQIIWFVALLILNTFAILEIIYIFFFSKKGIMPQEEEKKEETVKESAPEKIFVDIKKEAKTEESIPEKVIVDVKKEGLTDKESPL